MTLKTLRSTLTTWTAGAAAALCLMTLTATGLAAQSQNGTPAASREKTPAVVNLNTASPAELQTLPGVGASVAGRIVEYRQKNGGFKKVEDLMNVRGIGEKTFLKLKPLISVAPPKAYGL